MLKEIRRTESTVSKFMCRVPYTLLDAVQAVFEGVLALSSRVSLRLVQAARVRDVLSTRYALSLRAVYIDVRGMVLLRVHV